MDRMAELAINIDHIATLREARGGIEPDPVAGAIIAELAGAVGIVCHLREDRRHINDRDVRLLREVVKTKLDLEMAATPDIISVALDVLPDIVTIVPERREERTTEGGLDVASGIDFFADLAERMHEKDIEVSFFIEPEHEQIDAAVEAGADIIELHTGTYANAHTPEDVRRELTTQRCSRIRIHLWTSSNCRPWPKLHQRRSACTHLRNCRIQHWTFSHFTRSIRRSRSSCT